METTVAGRPIAPRRVAFNQVRAMQMPPNHIRNLPILMAAVVTLAVLLAGRLPVAAKDGVGPHPKSLAGRLLIADRSMPDARFAKAVLYMAVHDDRGAMGVIVNKRVRRIPADEFASLLIANGDLDPNLAIADIELDIFNGGPVAKGAILVLHDGPWRGQGSIEVADGIVLSQSFDLLARIVEGNGPPNFRLMFGHAGWAPRQLEGELERDDWISAPADPPFLFGTDPDTQWLDAVGREDLPL